MSARRGLRDQIGVEWVNGIRRISAEVGWISQPAFDAYLASLRMPGTGNLREEARQLAEKAWKAAQKVRDQEFNHRRRKIDELFRHKRRAFSISDLEDMDVLTEYE